MSICAYYKLTLFSFVDSGFWNFDALFVPQQHPARDMQDTFFVSDPPKADKPRADPHSEKQMDQMEASSQRLFSTGDNREKKPRDFEKYWNDVKKVHEEGAFGSIGCTFFWRIAVIQRDRRGEVANMSYRPLQVQGRGDITPSPPYTYDCRIDMGTSPIGRGSPTCALLLDRPCFP